MLQVEGAVVEVAGRAILDRVGLTVGPGETIAVLGPSGSGKTTLLRAVAGLEPLSAGRIMWDGADLAPVAPHERRFGLMFQEYALFPHRDVAGNVEFGLRMTPGSRASRTRRVEEMLDLVGLDGFGARRVASLSGGEQQRVALARALAVSPRLLMLDEPLGALDRSWRRRLLTELRSILDRAGLPALYVTHDHDEAFGIASRVAVMREGRVVQVGAPADVWRAPADVWTATFLGFGPAVEARVEQGYVLTPWGPIAAPPREPVGAVDAVLRPDAVVIDPDGVIEATIVSARFAGTNVESTAAVGGAPALAVVTNPTGAPAVGTRVHLSIDPGAVLVYPRTAD